MVIAKCVQLHTEVYNQMHLRKSQKKGNTLDGIPKEQESERMPRPTQAALWTKKQTDAKDHPELPELSDMAQTRDDAPLEEASLNRRQWSFLS